ncbi:putative phage tail protein [Aerococcus urinaeequi]|uniref:putative phage tail protein n=1 Tax=Aerococcus urinaeequi TaxID=51665 RepID=UPI003D6A41C8
MTLLDYMPSYYREAQEMNDILRAEDALFLILRNEFETGKANRFIKTADSEGLAIFESILGIVPVADESVESRRSRVLSRWINITPYTHNSLVRRLASLQGNYNFDINYELDAYRLFIRTNLELPGQVDELDYALVEMIPANLELVSRNEIPMSSSAQTYIAVGMTSTTLISATDAMNFDVEVVNNETSIASTIADTALIEMTDSYHASLSTNNDTTYISSAMAQISEITI